MRIVNSVILSVVLNVMPMVSHAYAEDRGYFHCFNLSDEQKKWFRSPGVSSCCDLADGLPVRFEERPAGIFVPPFKTAYIEAIACRDNTSYNFGSDDPGDNPRGDRSDWVKVDDNKVLRKSNPIGVGVIWYTNAGYPSTEEHDVRCFVGLNKV
jgi:hypothetical protein